MPTTVRKYGVRIRKWVPSLGAAIQQHELRQRYYNALTELDKPIQNRKAELVTQGEGAFAALSLTGEDLKTARAAMWQSIKTDPVLADLYTARRTGITPVRRRFAALGLAQPNYISTERAFTAAIATKSGAQFKRIDRDNGRISVLFTSGLESNKLYGSSNQIQIDPVDPGIYATRQSRKHGQSTTARLRVMSDERRKPIWLEFEIYLHRPIPDGSVREVSLQWKTIGRKKHYSLIVVVNTTDGVERFTPAPSGSVVSLNLGWSEYDSGAVRCGYWYGSDGQHGTVDLPLRWVNANNKVSELRSVRDRHMNAVLPALQIWLASVPDCPSWLRDTARFMGQWRSQNRLRDLELQWRSARFHGDESGFEMLKAFVRRDVHLGDYEANLRDQNLLERREVFRTAAAKLARAYAELRMEKIDLRDFAQRDRLALEAIPAARARRQAVAPSELRGQLTMIFEREGRMVKTVLGKTTSCCHHCGATLAVRSRLHICAACGTQFDVDYNAAKVMTEREPEVKLKTPRRARRFGKDIEDAKKGREPLLTNANSPDTLEIRAEQGP